MDKFKWETFWMKVGLVISLTTAIGCIGLAIYYGIIHEVTWRDIFNV